MLRGGGMGRREGGRVRQEGERRDGERKGKGGRREGRRKGRRSTYLKRMQIK